MIDKISKLLQNNNILKVLSFLIALIAFLIISQTGSPWWRDLFQQTQVVNNVTVTTNYDSDQYYISGVPDKMPINISGSENQLIAAKNQSNAMHVVIDLSGYSAGNYTVTSQDMKFDVPSGIKASSVIDKFNVDIQKKAMQDFPIELNYNDSHNKDGFTFNTPTLSQNSVTITGGSDTISSITNVQAIVDLGGVDVSNGNGSASIDAKLVAYNKDGNIVDNVTMSTDKINVSFDYKTETVEIPVNYEFSGKDGDQYVSLICPVGSEQQCNINTQTTVKIFGNNEKIKQLTDKGELTYSVDISKLDKNQGQVMGVALVPQGVFVVGGNSKMFDVKLEKGVSKEIKDVSLQTEGLASNLTIKAVSAKDGKVNITVTGANSVINGYKDSEGKEVPGLSAGDIQAYLDLSNITKPGTYEVPILVNKNKPFSFSLSNQMIKIEIVEA